MTDLSRDEIGGKSDHDGAEATIDRRSVLIRGAALGLGLSMAPLLGRVGAAEAATTGSTAGATSAQRAIDGVLALKKAGTVKDGDKITVLFTDGNIASWQGNDGQIKKMWEDATGTIMDLSQSAPTTGIYDKMILEAVSKTGTPDLFDTFPKFLGDFVNAKVALDLTSLAKKYNPEIGLKPPNGYIPPVGKWGNFYNNKLYQFIMDNDVMSLYVRKDLLNNKSEQTKFRSKYGYPLRIPRTWDQLQDIQKFFHRPPKLYGASEQRNRGWGYGWWMARFISKRAPFMPFFDSDMNPLLTTKEGIKTTNQYVATVKYSHPNILSWSFSETYGLMGSGKSMSDVRWPSLAGFLEGKDSKVKGKIAFALPPGDQVNGKIVQRSLLQFGTAVAVNANSKNAELAYLLLQWLQSPQIGPLSRGQAGFFDTSVRYNDIQNAEVKKKYPPAYRAISRRLAEIEVPEFSLPGANEYIDILDSNLQQAASGKKKPAQAMKDATDGWNKVTKRLGKASQAEQWRALVKSYR